jgi:hypothetical protein
MNEYRNSIHHQSQIRLHVFKEHPIKNHENEEYSEYDVTSKYYDTADFIFDGEFSDTIYCKAIFSKFSELSNSQIPNFINYQLELISDKKQWLYDLEKLIENNPDRINRIRPDLHTLLTKLIQSNIELINKPSIVGSSKRLKWKGTQIELLELITALTQMKRIGSEEGISSRAEVIEFFESIFIIELKDPEKKLTQTRGRKKGYVYFLDKLSENFKNWEQKRSK